MDVLERMKHGNDIKVRVCFFLTHFNCNCIKKGESQTHPDTPKTGPHPPGHPQNGTGPTRSPQKRDRTHPVTPNTGPHPPDHPKYWTTPTRPPKTRDRTHPSTPNTGPDPPGHPKNGTTPTRPPQKRDRTHPATPIFFSPFSFFLFPVLRFTPCGPQAEEHKRYRRTWIRCTEETQ
jgi:hypothetical protein